MIKIPRLLSEKYFDVNQMKQCYVALNSGKRKKCNITEKYFDDSFSFISWFYHYGRKTCASETTQHYAN